MCRCEDRVVQRLEQDFKATLQQQNSLEQWAAWLDAVVARVLKPHQGTPGFPRAAKLFLLKWSFYRWVPPPTPQTPPPPATIAALVTPSPSVFPARAAARW